MGSRRNPFEVIRRVFQTVGIPEAREVLFEEGTKLASMIQLNVLQQSLPMKELSRPYVRKKELEGSGNNSPEDKLIRWGDYVSEIKARWRGGRSQVEVGLPRSTHPTSGLPYKTLAKILEYGHESWQQGGKGIPARPHFRPTILQWSKKVRDVNALIQRRVTNSVFRRLNRRFESRRTNHT